MHNTMTVVIADLSYLILLLNLLKAAPSTSDLTLA